MERKALRSARLSQHWTLAQAAEHLEVDLNTLSRWEQGKTRPHEYNVVKLCQVYGKTAAELGLETVQEENALLVAPLSLPVLPLAMFPREAHPALQAKGSDDGSPLILLRSPDHSPSVSSLVCQQQFPRNSRGLRRMAPLVLLMSIVFIGGVIGYNLIRVPARPLKQKPSPSLVVGTVALPSPTHGIIQGGANPLPTRATPMFPSHTPGITPTPTPSMPGGTPEPTETPVPDCLSGSTSHLTFTSVLGLGNPFAQSLTLTNCGRTAQSWFASVTTLSGGNWLFTSPSMGVIVANGSVSVQIQAIEAGLQIGAHQGVILFTQGTASWRVTVAFTIVQV